VLPLSNIVYRQRLGNDRVSRRDKKERPMRCNPAEPRLTDVLADGAVRALMAADGVNPARLEGLLRDMAQKLANDRVLTRSPA
jgi:hypothetical protein